MGNAGRVLMIPKGDYNPATPYEMLDCVYYNGRSYVCKQASTGHAPTDIMYWQPMTPDSSAEIQALTNEVRGNWATGGVNLFDINNVYALKNASVSNGVLTNTDADSRTYFNCYMWFLDSSRATISSSQIGQYNSNGTFTKDITIPSGTKYIQLGHSGSSKDIYIDANTNIAAGDYKLYFKLTGYNPSTIGGLVVSDIMICDASITDPTYQPYAKTNVELTQDASWLTSAKTYYDANTDPTVKQNHYNVAKYFYDFIKPGESHTVIIRYAGGYYDTMILSRDNGTGLFCVDFCHADGLGKILYFRYNGTSDTFTDLFSVT